MEEITCLLTDIIYCFINEITNRFYCYIIYVILNLLNYDSHSRKITQAKSGKSFTLHKEALLLFAPLNLCKNVAMH